MGNSWIDSQRNRNLSLLALVRRKIGDCLITPFMGRKFKHKYWETIMSRVKLIARIVSAAAQSEGNAIRRNKILLAILDWVSDRDLRMLVEEFDLLCRKKAA